MLCVAQTQNWSLYVLAYLACCCGDTLASEIGSLSKRLPRNVLTYREVCGMHDANDPNRTEYEN